MSAEHTRSAIEQVVHEEWGRILATLVKHLRDFELAEDVLQDAVVAALEHWARDGVPTHPRAWLLRTARRKAIDRFRRDVNFEAKRAQLGVLAELESQSERDEVDETIPDERLRLVFTCCHPALAEQARVALTLRALGGLSTKEIARAFLVPEAAMAQRIVRAKRKIKAANIPFRVPPAHLWAERLESVLAVVYLIFNEGYAATSGQHLTRPDLCQEAIRLGQLLTELTIGEPETAGLLALMLLHDSRRGARSDDTGQFVPLEHQNRSLWNREQIELGDRHLREAIAQGRIGPYQLQAAISAVHAQAETYAATDWTEINLLYGKLYEMQPSPVIKLNASVAKSLAESPAAGLAAMSELEKEGLLDGYQPFHAARADLLRRAGNRVEAAAAYRRALELTQNLAEKGFLQRRLLEVSE